MKLVRALLPLCFLIASTAAIAQEFLPDTTITNLNVTYSTTLPGLNPLTVPYLDGSNILQSSLVTPTELSVLHGVGSGNLLTNNNTWNVTNKTIDGLSNTLTNINAVSVQGVGVSSTSPTSAQVLLYNSSLGMWAPVSMSGDATITSSGAVTVSKIQGNSVLSGAPTAGQALVWNSTGSRWDWETLSISGGGTGQTTKQAAFDALSPLSSAGDILTFGAGHNQAISTSVGDFGCFLSSGGAIVADSWSCNGSGLTNVNAIKLQGISVASTSPVGSQFLSYNGTAWAPYSFNGDVNVSPVGVVSVVALQGNVVASGTPASGQVLTWNSSATKWDAEAGGSGSGTGAKNYLATITTSNGSNAIDGNFEGNNTTGWTKGHVSLTNHFPSGTPTFGSGYDSLFGFSVVSSGQIAGNYSASYAESVTGTLTAGDFVASDAFNIDNGDKGKPITIKFYYSVNSAPSGANFSGTSANTLGLAIYDVTNSAWIMPAGAWNIVCSTADCPPATATFQTTSNSTQYRLVLFTANSLSTSSTPFFFFVDDFFLGPQTAPLGPAMTDWTSFTPTGGWSTNTAYTGKWRRVGDTMQIQYSWSLTGAPTGTLSLNLPSGYSIDTTKMSSTNSDDALHSTGSATKSGVSEYPIFATYNNTTSFLVRIGNTASTYLSAAVPVTATVPATWASGDFGHITITDIPITGWSSNSVMSSDAITRSIGMNTGQQTPTGTIAGSDNVIKFGSVARDDAAGYSTSTGLYTIPQTGWYTVTTTIEYSFASSAANQWLRTSIKKNGSTSIAAGVYTSYGNATQPAIVTASTTAYFNANDTVGPYSFVSGASASFVTADAGSYFSVINAPGPAVVAATETVGVRENNTSGFSVPNNSTTLINSGWTQIRDDHAWFSNGVFTTGVSGLFHACLKISTTPASTNTGVLEPVIVQGGSASTQSLTAMPFTTANVTTASTCDDFPMLGGDTLSFKAYQNNGASKTFDTTAGDVSVSIIRVGN